MILIVLASIALFFVAPALGILFGAFAGWVSGLFFPGTLDLVSQALFDQTIPHWQLGAALGFVGSFFKSIHTNHNHR